MIEFVFVRHGETESNRKGTYLGWTDIELNEKGVRQAYDAAEKLKGERFDVIYSSPLKRAGKTAEIIGKSLSSPVKYNDSLMERNFGAWDDLTHADILKNYSDEYALWVKDWKNYCMKGGESSMQAYNRVTLFIDELIYKNSRGKFLIVTHLGCIRKLIAHLLGMGIDGSWRFRIDNCGISRIEINDEKFAYLTALNK